MRTNFMEKGHGMLILFTFAFNIILFAAIVAGAASLRRGPVSGGIQLLLEKTAAVYEYAVYLAAIQLGLAVIFFFHTISNHRIITLDILYKFSLLMLIIFHNLKEPETLPCSSM